MVAAAAAVAAASPTLIDHEREARIAPLAARKVAARVRLRDLRHRLRLDSIERARMGERCVEVERMLDELRVLARAERRDPTGVSWSAGYHEAVAAAMATPRASSTYVGRTRQRNAHARSARAMGPFDIAPAIAAEAILARGELPRAAYQVLVRPVRLRGASVPEWGDGDA